MRWLDLEKVMEKTSLSHTAVYKLVREGKFPEPFKRGFRTFWVEEVIDAWMLSELPDDYKAKYLPELAAD